jgi:colanic acid biosynthesis glycosyl transferase WcaI
MKRIIFLNRFFFPDHSATSQILSDLAFHLAQTGYDVEVITSQQRYEDSGAGLPTNENVRCVTIHRVPTTQFGRSHLSGRLLDYASFYGSLWRAINRIASAGDILVAKTDPPMLGALVTHAARKRKAHLVNWLQDLYPEIAVTLGVPLMKGTVAQALTRLRDASLRSARANVVIGERMAAVLRAHAISPNRICVIPNWCADPSIAPCAQETENPLRRAWGLGQKFIFGYSGNLGRAHEFETVLEAARLLRNDSRIVFLIVGGGHFVQALSSRVRDLHLDDKFVFQPYQQQTTLNDTLNLPDLHWISLRPELEGLIVPSKFYSIAAAGKPMVIISAKDGELATVVRRCECGFVIEPGDSARLASLLTQVAREPDDLIRLGRAARAMSNVHFSREQAFAKWQQLLDDIAS